MPAKRSTAMGALLLVAGLGTALASPANWVSFTNAQLLADQKTSINVSDVHTQGEFILLWMKTEYTVAQPIKGSSSSYKTELRRRAFNCLTNEFATTAITWYEGEQGFSPVIASKTISQENWRFLAAVPDTAGYDWLNFACKFSSGSRK